MDHELSALKSAPQYYSRFFDFDMDNQVPTTAPVAVLGTPFLATVVQAGAGNAAITIDDAKHGVLKVINDDAASDGVEFQYCAEVCQFEAGKDYTFKIRDGIGYLTVGIWFAGLIITDTSIVASAPSDGLYLYKAAGAATVDLISVVGSSSTTVGSAIFSRVGVNSTAFQNITIEVQVNADDATKATVRVKLNNQVVFSADNVTITNHTLAPSFGYNNGAGGTAIQRTYRADYIGWAFQR